MPMNEHGFMEPDNNDRADWGKQCAELFMELTGSDPDTVVRDLVADLGHYFDRDIKPSMEDAHDFDYEVQMGVGYYEEEKREEEGDELIDSAPDADSPEVREILGLLQPDPWGQARQADLANIVIRALNNGRSSAEAEALREVAAALGIKQDEEGTWGASDD